MSANPLQLKVIVLGDAGVGKTSVLTRFVLQEFSKSYQATVGADFLFKSFIVDGIKISLQIWDTAGQERFQSLGNAFYRGSDCCILIYDITNSESFENLTNWKSEFLERSGLQQNYIPILLLGNKCDLSQARQVSTKLAKSWADKENFTFCEVSAKDNVCIEESFAHITRLCINRDSYFTKGIESKGLVLKSSTVKSEKKCCQ